MKIGILASGSGTNLQAIIDACKTGELRAEVSVIISNNSSSGALERGRQHGISTMHLSLVTHRNPLDLDRAMHDALRSHGVDYVLLAGYMKKLGGRTLSAFENRILNIHPALLPSFGGKGMFGIRVHEAVLKAGARMSGATVHLVTERYDEGPILNQRSVSVIESDSAALLQKRVLAVEHALFVETIQNLQSGRTAIFDAFGPAIVRPISEQWEIDDAVKAIRHSFKPVARRFGLTLQNCPTHPSFIEKDRLTETAGRDGRLFSCYVDNHVIGFYSLKRSRKNAGIFFLERLCVSPANQKRGIGATLLSHSCAQAAGLGAQKLSLGLIDAHTELKEWYGRRGFMQTEIREFAHLPFTVCFMEKSL